MHMKSPGVLGQLTGVTALSATNVWASGIKHPNGGIKPLLEHWNGTIWKIIAAPGVGDDYAILNGVASNGPDNILAAGSKWCTSSSCPMRTLAFRYNGTTWKLISTPNPAKGSNSDSFSADGAIPGTAQFWAVGSSGSDTLAAFNH